MLCVTLLVVVIFCSPPGTGLTLAETIAPSVTTVSQPCTSGGAIKFGIPWPKSSKPISRLDISIDGASQNVELESTTSVINIIGPDSPTVMSSSDSGTSGGELVVDGDISTGARSGSEKKPYWRVDLGESYDVHSVHITTCGTSSQTNLGVYVNDVEPLDTSSVFAFDQLTLCGSQALASLPQATTKSIDCEGYRGRFVGLQLQETDSGSNSILEICEVKVMVVPNSGNEAVSVSSDPYDAKVNSNSYLFKNFLRTSRVLHRTVTDGSENKIECPKGFSIAFGFSVQMTRDPALRSCVANNNKACTSGSRTCTATACGSPEQNVPGVVNGLVYAVCARGNILWPPPGRSMTLTHVGDGGKGRIACPRGQVLAFGFGLQWTPFQTSEDSSRRCLLRNNKACIVGAKACEQELCRTSDGEIRDRDVSFLWGICIREEELPFPKMVILQSPVYFVSNVGYASV